MYLTKLPITSTKRAYLLAPERLILRHSWISDSLRQANSRPKRYLWRLETATKEPQLLLLSQTKPNQQVLSRFGEIENLKTSTYQIDLYLKQDYAFTLVANPTKRNNQTHKVMQLTKKAEQLNWLKQKAQTAGFILKQVRLTNAARVTLKHNQQRPTKLQSVTFTGILQITDLTAFKYALTHGLGREKAYGFGLLTIKAV